jgi:hypothetical protein
VTAISIPGLWLPRPRPLWRPPTFWPHLRKSPTTGHLLKGSSGHLVNAPCPCPGGVCSHMSVGDKPLNYTCVVSGVSNRADCVTVGGSSYRWDGTSPSMNGSFCLTNTTACNWSNGSSGMLEYFGYLNTTCTNPARTDFISGTSIGLRFTATTVSLACTTQGPTGEHFRDSLPRDADNFASYTFTNEYDAADFGTTFMDGVVTVVILNYGGTVTVTPCC